MQSLIQDDIKLMRARYNEALELQGIACTYQFPNLATTNNQGEPVVDSYSELIETHIFFDSNPKVKTMKRFGWVVDNSDDLPFLIHCSWDLPHLQKDAIFRIAGQYSELPERVFRVTSISYDLQAPDHLVATIIPVYDDTQIVGRTQKEVSKIDNRSNKFVKQEVDYRGHYPRAKTDKE
ncbi:MAG: hypothetical protein NC548_61545 [Lachnospiraceae bacterium]|nr:hypothetical protein [Lachnospiraceae bacterium]